METLNIVLVALFGAGAGGAVSGVISLIRTIRQGRVDNEETLIKRLDADNKRQSDRAEEAEREAREYRRERDDALDEAARLRRILIENGINYKVGDGDERGSRRES